MYSNLISVFACDFENDMCPFLQRDARFTDDFDWTRRSDATPTANTGPMSGAQGTNTFEYTVSLRASYLLKLGTEIQHVQAAIALENIR